MANTEPEEVDELGRTTIKPNAAALRRERRLARIQRRRIRQAKGQIEESEDGYSTDSSLSPSDVQAYSEAIEFLDSQRQQVLADVRAEEFHDPGKGRWKIWRERYTDSYVNAWGSLGVVGVWEFLARLEMIGWDCIQVSQTIHDDVGSHSTIGFPES